MSILSLSNLFRLIPAHPLIGLCVAMGSAPVIPAAAQSNFHWEADEREVIQVTPRRIQSSFTTRAELDALPPIFIQDEDNPEELNNEELLTVTIGFEDSLRGGITPGLNTYRYPRDARDGDTWSWDPETMAFTLTAEVEAIVPDQLKWGNPYNVIYRVFDPMGYLVHEDRSDFTFT